MKSVISEQHQLGLTSPMPLLLYSLAVLILLFFDNNVIAQDHVFEVSGTFLLAFGTILSIAVQIMFTNIGENFTCHLNTFNDLLRFNYSDETWSKIKHKK